LGGGAFPVRISKQAGKQGIVKLCRVSSDGIEKFPQHVYHNMFVNNCSCHITDYICYCDVLVTNKSSFRNNKTENNLKNFCFVGDPTKKLTSEIWEVTIEKGIYHG